MICKKCGTIFDDSLSKCPDCGEPLEQKKAPSTRVLAFKLEIPEEKLINIPEAPDDEPFSIVEEAAAKPQEKETEDQGENVSEAPEYESYEISEEKIDFTVSEESEPMVENEEKPEDSQPKEENPQQDASTQEKTEVVEKDNVPEIKKVKPGKQKFSKKEKRAASVVVSFVCILAVALVGLSVVAHMTDFFKVKETGKAIALLGLSSQETSELETFLSKTSAVSKIDYDSSKTTAEDFVENINPCDENGLYVKIYSSPTAVTSQPDPASRFFDENENYDYYKLPASNVKNVLKNFGLNEDETLNTENCYYYDGNYYFAGNVEKKADNLVADVTETKKTDDGNYYITCNYYKDSEVTTGTETPTDNPLFTDYLIVKKEKNDSQADIIWTVKKISTKPLFEANGSPIAVEDENAVNYTMRRDTITQKTSTSKVLRKYVIDYPVFSGVTPGEINANQIYKDLISTYSQNAKKSDSEYKQFIKDGGNDEMLPLICHVTATVTFDEKGYFSIIEQIAETDLSALSADEEETTTTEDASTDDEKTDVSAVKLPIKTVSGYNFDVQTGDFVAKDTIVGKDYQLLSELLYRIYNGYDYKDLVATQQETTDEQSETTIPDDTDELGKAIYDSSSVLTKDGYAFLYVTEQGYIEKVTIPFTVGSVFANGFAD